MCVCVCVRFLFTLISAQSVNVILTMLPLDFSTHFIFEYTLISSLLLLFLVSKEIPS